VNHHWQPVQCSTAPAAVPAAAAAAAAAGAAPQPSVHAHADTDRRSAEVCVRSDSRCTPAMTAIERVRASGISGTVRNLDFAAEILKNKSS